MEHLCPMKYGKWCDRRLQMRKQEPMVGRGKQRGKET